MYVEQYNQQLGFIDAIFAVGALKNLFGFGKKKRARKQNVAENTGLYTAAFMPGTDFSSTLDLSPALSGYGKRQGAKTLREDFDAMFAHKDSWLVKNGVATPDDYAAYTIMENIELGMTGLCDPNQTNPNAINYKRCPTINGENVFRVMARQQAAPPPLQQPQVPAPVDPGPDVVDQVIARMTQGFTPPPVLQPFMPGAPQVSAPAPAPAPPPPATTVPSWVWWVVPVGALAAGALLMTTAPPRRRRR